MDVERHIDIDASPDVVWRVMTRVEAWPEWTASVLTARRLDEGALAVGRRVRIRQPGFPPTVWRITEYREGYSFTWVAGGPGIRVAARHRLVPRDGGSRVTLSLRFAGLLGPLFGRWTNRINERYVQMEAEGLKRRCETVGRPVV